MQYSHNCIKCNTKYEDNDPDAYLCEVCMVARKAIADQVNRTIGARPAKKVKSPLQEYDESPKVRGFIVMRLSDL